MSRLVSDEEPSLRSPCRMGNRLGMPHAAIVEAKEILSTYDRPAAERIFPILNAAHRILLARIDTRVRYAYAAVIYLTCNHGAIIMDTNGPASETPIPAPPDIVAPTIIPPDVVPSTIAAPTIVPPAIVPPTIVPPSITPSSVDPEP